MAGFEKLPRYLRLPPRSARRIRRDIDDELRLQIELRAEALEREGFTPEAARAEARRRFGDVDEAARYCEVVDRDAAARHRVTGWLGELGQDARHTIRILRRMLAFTAATVITLALAIGATTAVYGVLDSYLIRALPYPGGERLVSLLGRPSTDSRREPSLRDVNWRSIDSLFAATAAWDIDGFTLVGSPHAENVTGAWVSPGYFQALSVRPVVGRAFTADEYRGPAPVAIISHGLWTRRFGGDSGVIGATVTMHATDRPEAPNLATIVGVLPRDFWPVHWRESEVLRPLPVSDNWMPVLMQLKPGVSREATERRLDAVVRAQIGGVVDSAWHMQLYSPLERHSAQVRPVLVAVLGAVIFMLLAACGSVAGALVSRTAARKNELAVRLALGGSRWRLVRQLLTESAVLVTLAGALGIAIAYVLLDVAGPVIERQLGTRVPGGSGALRPTASIMVLSVVVSSIVGVLLGFIPALTFLRGDATSAGSAILSAGRSASAHGGSARVRRTLIAAQVMVSMVLLFGAGLMFRTIARMESLELGVRVEGVLTGRVLLPSSRYADSSAKRLVMDRLLTSLSETDGVRGAALAYPLPFGTTFNFPVLVEGAGLDDESAPKATVFTVSPGYFATMDVRLRTGRTFQPTDDHASPLVVVIGEALARRVAPKGDVIGRRIRMRVPHLASFDDRDERPWRTVIGVVTDTEKEFAPSSSPDVYVPYAQNPRSLQALVISSDRPAATMIDPVRRAISAVDPALTFSGVSSMAEIIAGEEGQRRALTVLLGGFAVFALGLSALALYASLSYMVVQRRAELAVRMALGAGSRSILRLVVSEGALTAGFGVAAGVVASLSLGHVLRNQVYGVATTDPATLVSISVVLAAACVAACAAPALRAVRTDPAVALRE